MSEAGPQVNGLASPTGKYIDHIDPDDPEYIKNLQRPAEVKEDLHQMENRSRVKLILNSQAFKEELEQVVEEQLQNGPFPASLIALQQITDLLLPHSKGGLGSLARASAVIPINDLRGVESLGFAKGEKLLRCKLAALYRLVDLCGWSHGIYNHISARVSAESEHFLLNPFGLTYSEVTASSLIKVDVNGDVVEPGSTHLGSYKTGFSVHAAIHQARPDIKCIVHLHTPAAVAVSALKCGLIPMSQEALICGNISYHDFQGLLVDAEEREKLARNLGVHNKVLVLRNRGILACGETVEEAFHYTFNVMAACEIQVKAIPLGLDNIIILSEEAREQAHKKPSQVGGGSTKERKWKTGELEFEALMRSLDNSGYRTGYAYKMPVVKQEKKERSNSDVEIPPSSSSFTYIFDGDYVHSKYASPLQAAKDRQKNAFKAGWMATPNAYKKTEIEEIGTTTPKKITKWVPEGDSSNKPGGTPVKLDNPNQFAPQGANPKEYKQKQKSIRKDYYEEKVTAGPQSKILDGVTWDEVQQAKDGQFIGPGEQQIVVGAASKGIIQRDHQHNAVLYRQFYAANPFENMSESEIEQYRAEVQRKERGEPVFEEQTPPPLNEVPVSQQSQEHEKQDTEEVAEEARPETATHELLNISRPAQSSTGHHTSHEEKLLTNLADKMVHTVSCDNISLEEKTLEQPTVTGADLMLKDPDYSHSGGNQILYDHKDLNKCIGQVVGTNSDEDEDSVVGEHLENHSQNSSRAHINGHNNLENFTWGRYVEESRAAEQEVRWHESTATTPEDDSVTIQLNPIQLYHGHRENGIMKVRFSIQSTVRRRIRAELSRGGGTIEEVYSSISEPFIEHFEADDGGFEYSGISGGHDAYINSGISGGHDAYINHVSVRKSVRKIKRQPENRKQQPDVSPQPARNSENKKDTNCEKSGSCIVEHNCRDNSIPEIFPPGEHDIGGDFDDSGGGSTNIRNSDLPFQVDSVITTEEIIRLNSRQEEKVKQTPNCTQVIGGGNRSDMHVRDTTYSNSKAVTSDNPTHGSEIAQYNNTGAQSVGLARGEETSDKVCLSATAPSGHFIGDDEEDVEDIMYADEGLDDEEDKEDKCADDRPSEDFELVKEQVVKKLEPIEVKSKASFQQEGKKTKLDRKCMPPPPLPPILKEKNVKSKKRNIKQKIVQTYPPLSPVKEEFGGTVEEMEEMEAILEEADDSFEQLLISAEDDLLVSPKADQIPRDGKMDLTDLVTAAPMACEEDFEDAYTFSRLNDNQRFSLLDNLVEAVGHIPFKVSPSLALVSEVTLSSDSIPTETESIKTPLMEIQESNIDPAPNTDKETIRELSPPKITDPNVDYFIPSKKMDPDKANALAKKKDVKVDNVSICDSNIDITQFKKSATNLWTVPSKTIETCINDTDPSKKPETNNKCHIIPSAEKESDINDIKPSEETESDIDDIIPSDESESDIDDIIPSDESESDIDDIIPSEKTDINNIISSEETYINDVIPSGNKETDIGDITHINNTDADINIFPPEKTEIDIDAIISSEKTDIDDVISYKKMETDIDYINPSEKTNIDDIIPPAKIETVIDDIIPSKKTETDIDDVIPSKKTETDIDDIIPSKKMETDIDNIIPSKKTETDIDDIIPSKKMETDIDDIIPSKKTETYIDDIIPSKKIETNVDVFIPSKKTETDIDDIIPSKKTETYIDDIIPSKKIETNVDVFIPSKKTETDIDDIIPSKKTDEEIDDIMSKKAELNLDSFSTPEFTLANAGESYFEGAIMKKKEKNRYIKMLNIDEGPVQTSSPKMGRAKSRESPFKPYLQKLGKSEETLLDIMPLQGQTPQISAKSHEKLEGPGDEESLKTPLSRSKSLGPQHIDRKKQKQAASPSPHLTKSKETLINDFVDSGSEVLKSAKVILDERTLKKHCEMMKFASPRNMFKPPAKLVIPATGEVMPPLPDTTEVPSVSDNEDYSQPNLSSRAPADRRDYAATSRAPADRRDAATSRVPTERDYVGTSRASADRRDYAATSRVSADRKDYVATSKASADKGHYAATSRTSADRKDYAARSREPASIGDYVGTSRTLHDRGDHDATSRAPPERGDYVATSRTPADRDYVATHNVATTDSPSIKRKWVPKQKVERRRRTQHQEKEPDNVVPSDYGIVETDKLTDSQADLDTLSPERLARRQTQKRNVHPSESKTDNCRLDGWEENNTRRVEEALTLNNEAQRMDRSLGRSRRNEEPIEKLEADHGYENEMHRVDRDIGCEKSGKNQHSRDEYYGKREIKKVSSRENKSDRKNYQDREADTGFDKREGREHQDHRLHETDNGRREYGRTNVETSDQKKHNRSRGKTVSTRSNNVVMIPLTTGDSEVRDLQDIKEDKKNTITENQEKQEGTGKLSQRVEEPSLGTSEPSKAGDFSVNKLNQKHIQQVFGDTELSNKDTENLAQRSEDLDADKVRRKDEREGRRRDEKDRKTSEKYKDDEESELKHRERYDKDRTRYDERKQYRGENDRLHKSRDSGQHRNTKDDSEDRWRHKDHLIYNREIKKENHTNQVAEQEKDAYYKNDRSQIKREEPNQRNGESGGNLRTTSDLDVSEVTVNSSDIKKLPTDKENVKVKEHCPVEVFLNSNRMGIDPENSPRLHRRRGGAIAQPDDKRKGKGKRTESNSLETNMTQSRFQDGSQEHTDHSFINKIRKPSGSDSEQRQEKERSAKERESEDLVKFMKKPKQGSEFVLRQNSASRIISNVDMPDDNGVLEKMKSEGSRSPQGVTEFSAKIEQEEQLHPVAKDKMNVSDVYTTDEEGRVVDEKAEKRLRKPDLGTGYSSRRVKDTNIDDKAPEAFVRVQEKQKYAGFVRGSGRGAKKSSPITSSSLASSGKDGRLQDEDFRDGKSESRNKRTNAAASQCDTLSDDQMKDFDSLIHGNPIELNVVDADDEEKPASSKKGILNLFSCIGGKSSGVVRTTEKYKKVRPTAYYEEGEKRKIKKLSREKDKEEKSLYYFENSKEDPENNHHADESFGASDDKTYEDTVQDTPAMPDIKFSSHLSSVHKSERYQKRTIDFKPAIPLSTFTDSTEALASLASSGDEDGDNSYRLENENFSSYENTSGITKKSELTTFTSFGNPVIAASCAKPVFSKFDHTKNSELEHGAAVADKDDAEQIRNRKLEEKSEVQSTMEETEMAIEVKTAHFSREGDIEENWREGDNIPRQPSSPESSKSDINQSVQEGEKDLKFERLLIPEIRLSDYMGDQLPTGSPEVDNFVIYMDTSNDVFSTPTEKFYSSHEYPSFHLNSSAPAHFNVDQEHISEQRLAFGPAHDHVDRISESYQLNSSYDPSTSFDAADLQHRRQRRTVSFNGFQSLQRDISEASLGAESSTSRPRSTSSVSNPLIYEPWRAKADRKKRSLSISEMIHAKGVARSRRTHSVGEAYNSTVASSVAKRRARTRHSNDITSRMYQPRQHNRSHSFLGDTSFGSLRPTRQRSFSGFDHTARSPDPSVTAVTVKRSESARQTSANAEIVEQLEDKNVEKSKSVHHQKLREELGEQKLASPAKSDTLKSADSASGGETLEERSSKEGSPTKEKPSPTKEKKKKKKFRIPSFSKKKSKESKESAA